LAGQRHRSKGFRGDNVNVSELVARLSAQLGWLLVRCLQTQLRSWMHGLPVRCLSNYDAEAEANAVI